MKLCHALVQNVNLLNELVTVKVTASRDPFR